MNISLAEFVRERAHQCCEYCRMPQIYDELPFQIDHVVAEQPGLHKFSATQPMERSKKAVRRTSR